MSNYADVNLVCEFWCFKGCWPTILLVSVNVKNNKYIYKIDTNEEGKH